MGKEKFDAQSEEHADNQYNNNEATALKEEQNNAADDKERETEQGLEDIEEAAEADTPEEDEVATLKAAVEESKDKYLRLYSEFENFRRRNAKERLELIKTANEDLVTDLLPVLDDFERAIKAMGDQEESKAVREGVELIQNKLIKALEQKGLKPMGDLQGKAFDADIHEAITQIPAPEESLKGKIVDVIEHGYYLNEKVIRYAKVVIGA